MNAADSMDLRKRLEKLERQQRVWRVGVLAAILSVSMLLLAYTRMDQPSGEGGSVAQYRQIEAQYVVIRDRNGQMRAWLGAAEDGPRIVFFDAAGQQRLGVGMTPQAEPAIGFFDGGQNQRIVLGMVEGWPGLVFRDPSGRRRMALHSREFWSSIFFFDKYETKRAGLGSYQESGSLNLCDARGRDRAGLTTDRTGSSLVFLDAGGQKRIGLGLTLDDEPAFGYFNGAGLPQLGITAINDQPKLDLYGTNWMEATISVNSNGPLFILYDSGRTPVWQAPPKN